MTAKSARDRQEQSQKQIPRGNDRKKDKSKTRSRFPEGMTERKARAVAADREWLIAMMDCLRRRSIAEGIKLLDRAETAWRSLELNDRHGAEVLLMLAQWVDEKPVTSAVSSHGQRQPLEAR